MSAVPFLARLLAYGFPGLALRDLGLPAGRLLPWLPGVRAGVSGPLEPGEAALLGRFRQAGRPLLGLNVAADAGRDPAWDDAPERLIWREAPGEAGDATLTLVHGGLGTAPTPAGQARLMLLLGSTEAMECHALLVAEARLAAVLDRLRTAAAELTGPDWRVGGRIVSPRLANLFAQLPRKPVHSLRLDAGSLPADVATPGLPAGTPRLRLLLGALPPGDWQLRLGFSGTPPGPVACFIAGCRRPSHLNPAGHLVTEFTATAGRSIVLGLAWPGGAPRGLQLGTLELRG